MKEWMNEKNKEMEHNFLSHESAITHHHSWLKIDADGLKKNIRATTHEANTATKCNGSDIPRPNTLPHPFLNKKIYLENIQDGHLAPTLRTGHADTHKTRTCVWYNIWTEKLISWRTGFCFAFGRTARMDSRTETYKNTLQGERWKRSVLFTLERGRLKDHESQSDSRRNGHTDQRNPTLHTRKMGGF